MLCSASVQVRNYGRRSLRAPEVPFLEHFESSREVGTGMNLIELELNLT